MTKILFSLVAIIMAVGSSANAQQELPDDLTRDYVVSKSYPNHAELGLLGWDPVSYFNETPAEGLEDIQENFGGILYTFSTEENRKTFLENPAKYEPTYGAWCAWAMSQGGKVPMNPEFYSFDLDDEGNKLRLHFFVNGRAMANFHNRRKVRRKTSLEILDLMKEEIVSGDTGAGSILDTARGFQQKADDNWVDILVNDK